jgi:soluble P-type ATPase
VAGDVARTNRQFDRTQQSLEVTQAHTRAVLADLAHVRQELGEVSVQVFLVTKALAQDAADLTTAHSELVVAQSDVSDQTTVIADLQTCLGGVQEALNALSVNDQGRAIDALDSVAPQCNATVASGG